MNQSPDPRSTANAERLRHVDQLSAASSRNLDLDEMAVQFDDDTLTQINDGFARTPLTLDPMTFPIEDSFESMEEPLTSMNDNDFESMEEPLTSMNDDDFENMEEPLTNGFENINDNLPSPSPNLDEPAIQIEEDLTPTWNESSSSLSPTPRPRPRPSDTSFATAIVKAFHRMDQLSAELSEIQLDEDSIELIEAELARMPLPPGEVDYDRLTSEEMYDRLTRVGEQEQEHDPDDGGYDAAMAIFVYGI